MTLVPVILAGGSGTRLWPESRTRMPKHLAPLLGERSLLQTTALRIMGMAESSGLLVVGAESQASMITEQLTAINVDWARHLIFEPSGRNTAAAIDLAARYVSDQFGADALIWVCPSDHVMADTGKLHEAVRHGLADASAGKIVTFGIEPFRPETGYGYIERGAEPGSSGAVFDVRRFVEKPPLDQAKEMLEAGGFLWNSGMFLMRADTLITAMQTFEPEIASAVSRAYESFRATGRIDPDLYAAVKSMPVDKAVMERTRDIMVVPCDPKWSDVGGWEAIWEISDKDDEGNAVRGDVLMSRSSNNLVRAGSRLVALAGVEGLAVVEVADAVLVARRDAGDEIRDIVKALDGRDRIETLEHPRAVRSWGIETRIGGTDSVQVAEFEIVTEFRLSAEKSARKLIVLEPGNSALEKGAIIDLAMGESRSFEGSRAAPIRLLEIEIR